MSITRKIKSIYVFTSKGRLIHWALFGLLNLLIVCYGWVNTVPTDFFQSTTIYISFLSMYSYVFPFLFILFLSNFLHPFQKKGVMKNLIFLSPSPHIHLLILPISLSLLVISLSYTVGSFLTFYAIGAFSQVGVIALTFPITIIYVTGLTLLIFVITGNNLYTLILLSTLLIIDYAANGMFNIFSVGLNGMTAYGNQEALQHLLINRCVLLFLGTAFIWLTTYKPFLNYFYK